jgi:6-phosphogluconolactonase
LSLSTSGKHLLLANYGAGNIVAYPITSNGELAVATANIHHADSGTNPRRQEAPHPHSIIQSPDSHTVFVPDLGLDKIKTYAFDENSGTLKPRPESDVPTQPGSGPRHLVFHPSGRFAFCSLEMGNEVIAYRYANGTLTSLGSYPTLPEDFQGNSTTAELRVSPNGKHVYISNRGHDSIAVFKLDPTAGTLARVQIISTDGKTPRNFALDPTGSILVVANQQSDTLVSFRVDQDTGILSPTGNTATIPAPTYILFY